MKKIFKIIGIILLIFIAILIAIPFVLESKIDAIVQNYDDENLDADLNFDDISLSLISSFPSAEINVENLKITNRAPFKDETLATAKKYWILARISLAGLMFVPQRSGECTASKKMPRSCLPACPGSKIGSRPIGTPVVGMRTAVT